MKVERREQRQRRDWWQSWRELKREGGREGGKNQARGRLELERENGVWEDGDGERKGEQEGTEYSAAVSRLADSVCSCSECSMRGGQGTNGKEEGAERKSEQVHVCADAFRVCLCAGMRVRGFPTSFGAWNAQPLRPLLHCCTSSGWDVRRNYFVNKEVFFRLVLDSLLHFPSASLAIFTWVSLHFLDSFSTTMAEKSALTRWFVSCWCPDIRRLLRLFVFPFKQKCLHLRMARCVSDAWCHKLQKEASDSEKQNPELLSLLLRSHAVLHKISADLLQLSVHLSFELIRYFISISSGCFVFFNWSPDMWLWH